MLYLLNGLCISVYGNKNLEQILVEQLFDQYQVSLTDHLYMCEILGIY